MAIYRNIQMSFWTDSKVVDEYTPEDRYFYLYLMTNPHTNLCGCYEISLKQISDEIGYTKETVEKLLNRFDSVHNSIRYSKETKEVLLINWCKYNWNASDKFKKALFKEINNVKNDGFKNYLSMIANGEDVSVEKEIEETRTESKQAKETKKNNKDNFEKIINEYTNNEELKEELKEYVKFRKKLKKGFTEHALELKLKKLDKLGNNDKQKIEVVSQSTMNGWQDFYEIKSNSNESNNGNPNWYGDTETEKASDELIEIALKLQKDAKGE